MNFFPKTQNFFEGFEELATIVEKSGRLLIKIKINSPQISLYAHKIRQLELQADKICHRLHHEANITFITPIDREDIYILARSLDNTVDLIENLISNINVYVVHREEPEYNKFTKLISETTIRITKLINYLKHRDKNIAEMKKLIIQINFLENKGDQLIRGGLQSLFSNHKDPIQIIKWKDLFENMEEILDECENTAYIVEEIIVKNF